MSALSSVLGPHVHHQPVKLCLADCLAVCLADCLAVCLADCLAVSGCRQCLAVSGCLFGSVYLTVFLAVSRSLSGSYSDTLSLVASVLWRPHNPHKLAGLNLI